MPSIDSQSIDGCGIPDAEQSNQPPEEFEKSNRDGGSITKPGPLRCESYMSALTFSVNFGEAIEKKRREIKENGMVDEVKENEQKGRKGENKKGKDGEKEAEMSTKCTVIDLIEFKWLGL